MVYRWLIMIRISLGYRDIDLGYYRSRCHQTWPGNPCAKWSLSLLGKNIRKYGWILKPAMFDYQRAFDGQTSQNLSSELAPKLPMNRSIFDDPAMDFAAIGAKTPKVAIFMQKMMNDLWIKGNLPIVTHDFPHKILDNQRFSSILYCKVRLFIIVFTIKISILWYTQFLDKPW